MLGVSNISYGMPQREILNRTFLAMTLQAGLDLPIINPADEGMKEIIDAFQVLSNMDKEGKNYISKYGVKNFWKNNR